MERRHHGPRGLQSRSSWWGRHSLPSGILSLQISLSATTGQISGSYIIVYISTGYISMSLYPCQMILSIAADQLSNVYIHVRYPIHTGEISVQIHFR